MLGDIIKQYDTLNKAYLELLFELCYAPEFSSKTRKGEQINEKLNAGFTLLHPSQCFATCRNMSFDYLKGELEFYLSGSPYLKDIVKHSKFWDKVTDDGRTVNSNYGKLLFFDRNHHNYTQYEYAKKMLIENPDSKKAVMTIYSKENAHDSNDNPCTMYLQFFIRKGYLHLFVKMRSSDIWYGLPYDVPFFVFIQHKMFFDLIEHIPDLKIGTYNHQSGSLHLYERNHQSALATLIRDSTLIDELYINKIEVSEWESFCYWIQHELFIKFISDKLVGGIK